MYKGKQQILIENDVSKVYEVAEQYPHFVNIYLPESKIVFSDPDKLSVEVHAKLFGFYKTKWTGEGIKHKNTMIDFTQTEGLFKGLKAIWRFDAVKDGTIASIETIFTSNIAGGNLDFFLGKYVVEAKTKKILSQLKEKSEAFHP